MSGHGLMSRVLVRSTAILLDTTAFESGTFQVQALEVNSPSRNSVALMVFANSDQNGQLQVFQGFSLADLAVIPVAASTANQQDFNLVGAGTGGLVQVVVIFAPFMRIRFLNNSGGNQTIFRLHAYCTE